MNRETITGLLRLLREVEDGYMSAVLALFADGESGTVPELFRFPKQPAKKDDPQHRTNRQDWSRVKDYAKLLGAMVTWVEANRAVIRNLEGILTEMQDGGKDKQQNNA